MFTLACSRSVLLNDALSFLSLSHSCTYIYFWGGGSLNKQENSSYITFPLFSEVKHKKLFQVIYKNRTGELQCSEHFILNYYSYTLK